MMLNSTTGIFLEIISKVRLISEREIDRHAIKNIPK